MCASTANLVQVRNSVKKGTATSGTAHINAIHAVLQDLGSNTEWPSGEYDEPTALPPQTHTLMRCTPFTVSKYQGMSL